MGNDTVSEDTRRVVAVGFRNAAMFFLYFVDELEQRFGKAVAHDIARRVVKRKGLAAGEVVADELGRGGLGQLALAHAKYYPTTTQISITPTRYVAEDETCFVCAAWKAAGLSPERIRELGDIYCWGDLAFAQAFDQDIALSFDRRQADGSTSCRWIFTRTEGE
jgi:hypothetical protein